MEITGCPLVFRCPSCEDEVKPNQMLLSEKRTLLVTSFCMRCQSQVCFDFSLMWLFTEMKRIFPQKLLPMSKNFTLLDISQLHQMGIADEMKGDDPGESRI